MLYSISRTTNLIINLNLDPLIVRINVAVYSNSKTVDVTVLEYNLIDSIFTITPNL
jgi:hypothetical protein